MAFNKNSHQQNYFSINVMLLKYEKVLFKVVCFDLLQELFGKVKWPYFLILTSLMFPLIKQESLENRGCHQG